MVCLISKKTYRCVEICTAGKGNTIFALEVVAVVLVEVVGVVMF